MPIVKPLDLPPEKLDDLARYLTEKFRMVQTARLNQIDDKALNWQKNYDGMPAQAVRTVPFYRASNFMPQLIRMHSDILAARQLGIIFGTKPFWRVKTLLADKIPHEQIDMLSLGMNYLWENELGGFEASDEIVNQALQTGTLTLKAIWSDDTSSYMAKDGEFAQKTDSRMQYDPVPFEDFWPYPLTARSTRLAEVLFHRIRLTERDVNDRKQDKRWDGAAADLLMKADGPDPLQDATAQSTGINLTPDTMYPFSAIECWLRWDIGSSRKPIVVVLNPMVQGRDAILKAYYNFMPLGEVPFIEFVPMPRKNCYYGYSVPEVLEQAQEEQAQIHNARRDSNTIANVPTFKKLRYAEVPNPATDWYPGFIFELDKMDDLEMMPMIGNYNAMIDEEQFLMSLAERYVGISPSMQGFGAGQSAGKRGVYATGATLALLSEGNKRMDIYIRRMRSPYHRLGRLTALSYNQWGMSLFSEFGETGEQIREAFNLVSAQERRLLYDLSASDAASNREVDRQSLLQMAGVAANYYQRIVEAAQLLRTLKPEDPLFQTISGVVAGARDLFNRILFAFDQGDRERLAPDLGKIFGQSAKAGANESRGLPEAQGVIQPSELENALQSIAAVSQ